MVRSKKNRPIMLLLLFVFSAYAITIHPSSSSLLQQKTLKAQEKVKVGVDYELKVGLEAEVSMKIPAGIADGHNAICTVDGVKITGDMFDAEMKQTLELVTEPVDFNDGVPNLEPLLKVVRLLKTKEALGDDDTTNKNVNKLGGDCGAKDCSLSGKVGNPSMQATFGIQVKKANLGCRTNMDCKKIFEILDNHGGQELYGYYPDLHFNLIKKQKPRLSPDNDPEFKNAYGLYPRWKASLVDLDITKLKKECVDEFLKEFNFDPKYKLIARAGFNVVKNPFKSENDGWIALVEERSPGIVIKFDSTPTQKTKNVDKDGKVSWTIVGGDMQYMWAAGKGDLISLIKKLNGIEAPVIVGGPPNAPPAPPQSPKI